MINGLNVGSQPRVTPSNGDSKTGVKKSGARADDQANFADQLLGDKSGGIGNQNRNDRKTSGRDSNREEQRSNDRERDSRTAAARPEKQSSERSQERKTKIEPKRDTRKERSADRVEATRAPGSEYAPIVIESPKKTEEPEMKLPDFFGKIDGKSIDGKALSADAQAAAGASVDALKTMQAGEQLSRAEAMAEFMEGMQAELGISPEKILQALSNLDASVLQAPPEESVGQFIDGLDLIPGNEERATELYQDLLKKTGDSIIGEKVAGLDSSVNFNIMSKQDDALQKLNSSLDGLNKSFFSKGTADEPKKAQAALESMDAALAKLMRGQENQAASAANLGALGLVDSQADLSDALGDDALSMGSSEVGGDVLAGLMAANQNPLAAALQSGSDDSLSFLSDDAEEIPLMAGQKEATSDFAKELAADDSDVSDLSSDAVSTEALADLPASGSATPIASALSQGIRSAGVTSPSDMMMNRQASAADEQANVRDLIENAQVLVKRGGGEMKVEMTPEGMGKIQLKVAVENGQVNVQMTTESDQAKRILEKGMSELRTSLAAHDLKVESMRVDVGNDVSRQMDQQGTQDQARQQARQFAQDFMGSFRDERQAFRQGMFEQNGWRSYGRNQRRENMGPEGTASVSSTSSVKSNGDKRLNVVA